MSEPEARQLYKQILFERLGISPKVFEDNEQLKEIRERLAKGDVAKREGLTEFVSVNLYIHVASSVVLLESESAKVRSTLNFVEDHFSGIDPTTVVTSSSLYYIIKCLLSREDLSADERDNLTHVWERFQEINWLIGSQRMAELGFD